MIAPLGLIAGVDEAGRGPLAGPVSAAAVILDPDRPILGIRDSKRLSARRRETLAETIREQALDWAVAWASVAEIERLNILHASLLAMQRAVALLETTPAEILVDGNRCPEFACPGRALIDGDDREPSIGAASILAKVARDACMVELDAVYPGYGLARHKGYPTRAHLEALAQLGPCAQHRRGFAPVRRALAARKTD